MASFIVGLILGVLAGVCTTIAFAAIVAGDENEIIFELEEKDEL